MIDQHPITPPPELFKQWEDDILNERENVDVVLDCAWKNGFRAGADQELEACCEWLKTNIGTSFSSSVERELRADLALYGHHPAPPAEGEVTEESRYLVKELRDQADDLSPSLELFGLIHRAADLLERQATACAICERERLHQSTRAADLEVERQAAPVPVAAAGLCELADDLREQASQGYCEFISREDLRRVADVLEQLAVSAHKQEPAVGPPSDDELLELAQHHSVSYTMSDGSVVYPLQHGCDMRDDVLSFARAVLARWGHQPAPVPVTERLPGPEDCDEEGFCWWFSPSDPSAGTFGVAACWVLRKHEPEDDFRTHWLPATALPLPSGEVE